MPAHVRGAYDKLVKHDVKPEEKTDNVNWAECLLFSCHPFVVGYALDSINIETGLFWDREFISVEDDKEGKDLLAAEQALALICFMHIKHPDTLSLWEAMTKTLEDNQTDLCRVICRTIGFGVEILTINMTEKTCSTEWRHRILIEKDQMVDNLCDTLALRFQDIHLLNLPCFIVCEFLGSSNGVTLEYGQVLRLGPVREKGSDGYLYADYMVRCWIRRTTDWEPTFSVQMNTLDENDDPISFIPRTVILERLQ